MEPTNRIKALLEKYWLAETTDAEEVELKEYFGNIPAGNDQPGSLFHYFRKEQTVSMDKTFDARLEAIISTSPVIPIWRRSFWKVAATLLILISTVLVIQLKKADSTSTSLAATDTYKDPDEALKEARQSLLLISEHLNKAKQYTLELKKLGKPKHTNP